jgi:hypothetical protein
LLLNDIFCQTLPIWQWKINHSIRESKSTYIVWDFISSEWFFILSYLTDCAFESIKLTDICSNFIGFEWIFFQLNLSAYARESENIISEFHTICCYVILFHCFNEFLFPFKHFSCVIQLDICIESDKTIDWIQLHWFRMIFFPCEIVWIF